MPVGDLFDDCQPKAGARQPACVGGAIEALEHVRQVGRRYARTLVDDLKFAAVEPNLHGGAGRTPLGRVVQDVGDRSFECGCISFYDPGSELHIDGETRCATFNPIDRSLADLCEILRLALGSSRVVPGKLDEVLNQNRELLTLSVDIGKKLTTVLVGQAAASCALDEEVEIGAQARKGGPQLMPCVGHQLLLALSGTRQGCEHRVEARRQPGQLVVSAYL